ncbi:DUF7933 domain-containing protein [Gilvimarinus polysaccharolyticus]|uniref:DUF7933 domain-containing protein n=1 Tax=Gilvimarinus polysaccharolyticus TaxID=863921 RepID=UPI00067329FF|nr:hypothetical protein [Gilvimarinus polysaccharolyticus]
MKFFHRLLGLALVCAMPNAIAANFNQDFSPATIGQGGLSRLTFTVENTGLTPETNLNVTNTLPAGISVANVSDLQNSCMGQASAPNGGNTISLSGGRLGAGKSCTFSALVTGSTIGSFTNTSGDLTSSSGNSGTSSDDLTIAAQAIVSLTASPNTLIAGSQATLTYTVDNSAGSSALVGLDFSHTLPKGITFAASNESTTTCGYTTKTLTAEKDDFIVRLNGIANPGFEVAAAGASCTITTKVQVNQPGTFTLVSALASNNNYPSIELGFSATGITSTASSLHARPALMPDTVTPSSTTTLELLLSNTNREFAANNLTLTVDLESSLTGLIANNLDASDCGGSFTGTQSLNLSGAQLAPGGSCTLTATLNTPANATAGDYPLVISSPSATINSVVSTATVASRSLTISDRLTLSKTFSPTTTGSGGSTTLTFTLTNPSPSAGATNIEFDEFLPQAVFSYPINLPANGTCGGASTFSSQVDSYGNNYLRATNLIVAPNSSCSFDVDMDILPNVGDNHLSTGSDNATFSRDGVDGQAIRIEPNTLNIISGVHASITPSSDVVAPGDSIQLTFDLGSGAETSLPDQDVQHAYSNIGFSLSLDAVMPGLTAINVPSSACNGSLTGSSVLMLSGATLAGNESCRFTVDAIIPSNSPPGTYAFGETIVTATSASYATESLLTASAITLPGINTEITFLDMPYVASDTATVQFTLTNPSGSEPLSNISLSLDLNTLLPGMTASLPVTPDPACGIGSSVNIISGNRTVQLSNASLAANTSCSFTVNTTVPASATAQLYHTASTPVQYTLTGSTYSDTGAQVLLSVYQPGIARDLTLSNAIETDPDGDGLLTADEGPLGDVNQDGILDAIQANVASIISPVTGLPVSLVFDAGCTLDRFTMVSASSLGGSDALYPDGLADFAITCASSSIELHLPGGHINQATLVSKYGPQAPNFAGPATWYTPPGVTINKADEYIHFALVDGSLGDSTDVDGMLVDPIGVGGAAAGGTSLPINNPWALLLTALGLCLMTLRYRARLAVKKRRPNRAN